MRSLFITIFVSLKFGWIVKSLPSEVRIIGGAETGIEAYPYVVSLQYNGTFDGYDVEHFCAGVIINERWIGTAAKCIDKRKPGEFNVRVGSKYYFKEGVIHEIDSLLIHPKYTEIEWDYDVGLIEVHKPIEFDLKTQPVQLPLPHQELPAGTNLAIVGWGATKLLGPPSPVINANIVPVISQSMCEDSLGHFTVTPRMFCIFKHGNGPCVGDTGSPGVVNNTLFGLASWSPSCAYQYPTVYTNLSTTVDWINQIIRAPSAPLSPKFRE
ncbi:trypsin-like [Diachasmimorpha longicaudata]|uniref:trypsin-like n=1 Tax=Diachasmimorpha longicaudata TaxID=58733 RepID=UPI0030B900B6